MRPRSSSFCSLFCRSRKVRKSWFSFLLATVLSSFLICWTMLTLVSWIFTENRNNRRGQQLSFSLARLKLVSCCVLMWLLGVSIFPKLTGSSNSTLLLTSKSTSTEWAAQPEDTPKRVKHYCFCSKKSKDTWNTWSTPRYNWTTTNSVMTN